MWRTRAFLQLQRKPHAASNETRNQRRAGLDMIKVLCVDDVERVADDRVQDLERLAVHANAEQLKLEAILAGLANGEVREAEEGGGQSTTAAVDGRLLGWAVQPGGRVRWCGCGVWILAAEEGAGVDGAVDLLLGAAFTGFLVADEDHGEVGLGAACGAERAVHNERVVSNVVQVVWRVWVEVGDLQLDNRGRIDGSPVTTVGARSAGPGLLADV